MIAETDTEDYFDVMDFPGFAANYLKITITSVFHEYENGFSQIKVFSKISMYVNDLFHELFYMQKHLFFIFLYEESYNYIVKLL